MNTVEWTANKSIPVIGEFDVVVVGGGPGGLGAAVIAARAGARVALVERYGFLGGMAASGEIHPFMPNHLENKSLDGPVYTDWLKAMTAYRSSSGLGIAKEAAVLAAEDLCLAEKITLLYHHTLVDVAAENRMIRHIILHSKSGFGAMKGGMYVDCSGDGDLAALSGCEYEEGGPSGDCQPMTLCFKLNNVDKARIDWPRAQRLYAELKESGKSFCPRENILRFDWFESDVVHFNTTRVTGRKGTNGLELSQAEIEARRQMREFIWFFRKEIPGFENCEIHSMGSHIGVRETRRIKGLARLTREDFKRCCRFDDAVAKVNYPIDIHSTSGAGTEITDLPPGEWYEIPYGCVVPKDIDNLTVGGRPISVDHAVHSSMRVMPPACTVGQAAGIAAALAVQGKTLPCRLDGVGIRNALVRMGAPLGK